MAYFIGNGTVTIGGGSLGRTEQLPSLKILCVDLCARHLERLGDLGDIPTEVFVDLLRRAKEKATPALVKRLQDINERLWCDDVDTAFWKQAVEGHILRRTVPAPGPVLVKRVNDHKERLHALQSTAPPSAETSAGGLEAMEWARDVTKVLEALEDTPVSIGLLKATLIGKAVSPLRKSSNGKIARMATELLRRWKEAAAATTPSGEAGAGSNGTSTNGGSGEVTAVQRSPAEEKQRAVEEGFRCQTWESLYQHLELLRAEKVRLSSKRAREAREREQEKRPRIIVGKSKGQNFTAKTGRMSTGKNRAPSFFAASSSSPSARAGAAELPPLSPPKTSSKNNTVTARSNSSSKHAIGGGGGGGGGSNRSKYKGGGSSTGTFSSRSSSTSKVGGSKDGGGSGDGRAKKLIKKNDYNSGTSSVAELRRKIISDQRLSTPVKAKTPGGCGGGGAADAAVARLPTPKRSKFWK